jgi:hypothetical protein
MAVGRPPRGDAPSKVFTIRLTQMEVLKLVAASRLNHQNPAVFARDAVLCAVFDTLDPEINTSPPIR